MSAGFRAGQANDGYLQINGTDILAVSSGVLGIKNTGAQSEMRLFCESSNAHYASLKAPPHSDFIGNVTFTLPGTAGSSGQVLQTDGSGNLSWTNNSSGGGGGVSDKMSEGNTEAEVVDTGSDGHFKVTTEGDERLRITSTGQIQQTNFSGIGFHMSGSGDPTLQISDTDGTNQHVMLAHNGGDSYIVTRNNTSHGGFRVYSQNGSETLTRLRIDSVGNVSLGTPSPNSYTNYTTLTINGTNGGEIDLEANGTLIGDIFAATSGLYLTTRTSTPILFRTNGGNERLRIGPSGQIGLGGANYGTAGQVLTSGGSGAAPTWTTISGGGGSYGNSDVDNHLNTGGASSGQILSWNGSDYAWVADQTGSGGGGGLSDLVDDTSPQLGGNLDINSKNITGTGNIDITGNATITSTDSGNSAGPELSLYRNSSSPANADYIGQIKFQGESSTGATRLYAKITGKIGDPTNGSEDGIIEIAHRKNGSNNISARWNQDELQLINGTELSLGDDQKIKVGTGDDLQLYHASGGSYIDNTTGDFYIRGANGSNLRIQSPSGENSVVAQANGGVELYYDNTKRLETTYAGATLTGALTATSFVKSGGTSSQYLMADGSVSTGGGGSGISNVVEDTTPQLGGNLDVQASEINTSTTNGNIKLTPNGTGVVEVKGAGGNDGILQLNCSANSHGVKIKSPPHSAAASYTLTLPDDDGNANQVLQTDGSGNLSWATVSSGGGGGSSDKISEGNTEAEVVDTGSDGHFKVTTEGTERMRILSDGRVIMGGGSTVYGNANADDLVVGHTGSGHRGGITIAAASNQDARLAFSKGTSFFDSLAGYIVYQFSDNRMATYVNMSERFAIDSNGKILIGHNGLNGRTSTAALEIYKGNSTNDLAIINSTADDSAGARSGNLLFSGRQSGGERTTLASIGSHHEGTADDEKGVLMFRTNDGSDGDSPTERLRIDSDGHIRAYGDAGTSSIADAKAAFATINAVVPSAGGTAALNVLSRGSGTQENIVLRSITTDGWAGAQFRAENYNFTIRTTNVLTVDFNGSAQFKGKNRPSGLDTRISQYGSLLVATSGELISNARCSIDSGNGNIITQGSIQATGVNLQNSSTSSWFQTGTSIASYNYVWAAKNSSSNTWHSGLQTDGDLYLGGNLAGTNNIGINGSNGSAWFSGSVAIGGNASANTIDEYEEGTFDPTISPNTGSITLNSGYNTLSYTRIGRLVHISGQIRISSVSSPSGNTSITNLPFTVQSTTEQGRAGANCFYYDASAGSGNYYKAVPIHVTEGTTTLKILNLHALGGLNPAANDEIAFAISYVTP